jgi:lysozyme
VLRWLALAAALGLAAAGAVYLYFRTFEPDRERFPVRGIDVSHHQGEIDWARVAKDDVAFAFIKATEGGDFRDKRFAENWAGARSAGIAAGAYHFYRFCRPAADQAENIIATVPKEADALPLVLDVEFGGNCKTVPTAAELVSELTILLERVEAHFGRQAILYVTQEIIAAYGPSLPKRPLWVRSILAEPPACQTWAIWQYHNRGTVEGITGAVDLNVLAGRNVGEMAAP